MNYLNVIRILKLSLVIFTASWFLVPILCLRMTTLITSLQFVCGHWIVPGFPLLSVLKGNS